VTTTPEELIKTVRAAGGVIAASGDKIVLKAPSPLPEPLLQELRSAKQGVMRALTEHKERPACDDDKLGTAASDAPRVAQAVRAEGPIGSIQGEPRRSQSHSPSDESRSAAFERRVFQKPPDGNASTVLPGGEPRCPDTLQEWQAWIDERVKQYRGLRWSEGDARRRAWGEAENHWHFRDGRRPDPNRCAGCGGPLVRSQGARQVDGAIVHLDGAHGVNCLIRYGEQWRSKARGIALGLEPPSA
jgi:hypothetical protein